MEENLPIIVVMQKKEDTIPNDGGGERKFFCEYTEQLGKKFINQLRELDDNIKTAFSQGNKAVVAKINMKSEAIAKSHKPNRFCKEMPIIGGDDLDEILIRIEPDSIAKTIESIKNNPPKDLKANMTAIAGIENIRSEEKISEHLKVILKNQKFDSVKNRIKVELYEFDDEYFDLNNISLVEKNLLENNICTSIKEIKFDNELQCINVTIEHEENISKIASLAGVRSVGTFDNLSSSLEVVSVDDKIEIVTDGIVESEVIIGIVDSGIADIPELKNYIYAREEYVPKEYQNRNHGTFVASTIQYGDQLNGFSTEGGRLFKFLDIVALPNENPRYGLTDVLYEEDFMIMLDEVMQKYSQRVKVWNFSLGFASQVCDSKMSSLGKYLDKLQDKYGVQIFISSGNLPRGVIREWPVKDTFSENDKIIAPADSVRAMTVGSIALQDCEGSAVKKFKPSPFSRRGPGPNFTVKPEIVDFGGNVKLDTTFKGIGIKGLNENGNVVEQVGTSFACPNALKKYALILDEMLLEDTMLAKALLIHSARLNSKESIQETGDIDYYGFGIPKKSYDELLRCKQDEVTLVFKQKLTKGTHLEMKDFPFPKSLLRDDKWYGEICMTLAYAPKLDRRYDKEYCRSNVEVGFGTYYMKDGELKFSSEVPIEKTWDGKYEKERVTNGFKWCPVKSYYRKIKNGIKQNLGWKIRVDMVARNNTNILEQEFVLIVTIKDSQGKDIYTEIVNELRARGYAMNNLETRLQTRLR